MKLVHKRRKAVAIFLLLTFLFQLCIPIRTFALTGGPSQPEVQSFEPVGTTDMVDLFTGDFNYNIPLLDVEGYPINIAYHSGISMDQEASWVGLGWNINPGVINRNMRGLPDDFKGDEINQIFDTKPHKTIGYGASFAWELFGKEMFKKLPKLYKKNPKVNLGISLGIKYDNYRGMGLSMGLSPSVSISDAIKENDTKDKKTAGLDISFDSQYGMEENINYSKWTRGEVVSDKSSSNTSLSASLGFNSRSGFTGLTLSKATSNNWTKTTKDGSKSHSFGSNNGGTFFVQNHPSYQPSAKNVLRSQSYSLNSKMGLEFTSVNPEIDINGYYTTQKYDKNRTLKGYGAMYNESKTDNFLQDFNRYNEGSYSKTTHDLPLSVVTSDYFSVSGQGIGGSYKVKQSYVPIVYDDEVFSNSTNLGLGTEAGAGNILKLGINASVVFTSNRAGVKKFTANEKQYLIPTKDGLPADYEYSYFKYVGEKTPVPSDYYNAIRNKAVIKPTDIGIGSIKTEREKRNQVLQYLTVKQINDVPGLALDQKIKSYPLNSLEYLWNLSASPIETTRGIVQQDHHISEVSVLSDDGRRYVYGIPAMNTTQKEFTFSCMSSK